MTDHEKEIEMLIAERDGLQSSLDEALKELEQAAQAMKLIIVGQTDKVRALQAERDFHRDGATALHKAVDYCVKYIYQCKSCANAIATYNERGFQSQNGSELPTVVEEGHGHE